MTNTDTRAIKLDRASLLAAIQSRQDWKTQRHIASELGVSQATVSRVMREAGIALSHPDALQDAPSRAVGAESNLRGISDAPRLDSRPEGFTVADFNRLCAGRAKKLIAWLKSGNRVSGFPGYDQMTAREISVAIGWTPWPKDWTAPYGARESDQMAAHITDCQCEPCSSCRPAKYTGNLADET